MKTETVNLRVPLKNISLYIILLCFLSCKEKKNNVDYNLDEGIQVLVELSAGELFEEFNYSGLPTFFNLGTLEKSNDSILNVIVLGQKITSQTKINTFPLNTFQFSNSGVERHFLITIPGSRNFDKESLKGSQLLELHQTIEQWFRLQCPTGQCQEFKWGNTYNAILNLETKYLKQESK